MIKITEAMIDRAADALAKLPAYTETPNVSIQSHAETILHAALDEENKKAPEVQEWPQWVKVSGDGDPANPGYALARDEEDAKEVRKNNRKHDDTPKAEDKPKDKDDGAETVPAPTQEANRGQTGEPSHAKPQMATSARPEKK